MTLQGMDDYIAEQERGGEWMFDELHSDECGCWLCDGREPDARNVYVSLWGFGRCANCGDPLRRGDNTVHAECESQFIWAIQNSW